ncbi:uncharacterized protein DEA37_0008504 [Paragonimus westermani]|uniref:Uncharacterized protein n=1 Tax=Paragonimus westermani TaxID=34504 RepID=A0A5J4P3C4_9TREM|nr:uncharacterized protein DEA37_0008504 [Paragonimus westermani]
MENPTASETSSSQPANLQATTTQLIQIDVLQNDSTKTSEIDQASATWKTLQPCRPLIPEIDHLQAGFAWEWLLKSTNRLIGQRCEPGIELQVMHCTQTLDNRVCPTNQETRQVHCWINERCANGVSKLEPPAGCVFTTILNELFLRIIWYRTPYGTMPIGYQIRLMVLKPTMKHQLIVPDVRNISMGSVDPWGERYVIEWTGLVLGWAYEVTEHGPLGPNGALVALNVHQFLAVEYERVSVTRPSRPTTAASVPVRIPCELSALAITSTVRVEDPQPFPATMQMTFC